MTSSKTEADHTNPKQTQTAQTKALTDLTEPHRLNMFQNSQEKWAEKSAEVVDKLSSMAKKGCSLLELYDFARNRRAEIAVELGQNKKQKKNLFGMIRTENLITADEYAYHHLLVEGEENLFTIISQRVNSQRESFNTKKSVELSLSKTQLRANEFISQAPKEPLVFYETDRKDPSDMSLSAWGIQDPNGQVHILKVSAKWGITSEKHYKEKLDELDKLLKEAMDSQKTDQEFLECLAELMYELSRAILLTRGTAAVDGWLARALAQTRGIDLGKMHVNGLPFDICAELTLDKKQYIKDFVQSFSKDFITGKEEETTFTDSHSNKPDIAPSLSHQDQDFAKKKFSNMLYLNMNLSKKKINDSDFSSTVFKDCSYEHVDFSNSNFHKTVCTDCDFSFCSFNSVGFLEANFSKSTFMNSSFLDALLVFTNFSDSSLIECNLTGADLRSTRFVGTNLTRSNLTSTILVNADLTNADLSNANLSKAHLGNANLKGAILAGADFSGANLTRAKLQDALFFVKTDNLVEFKKQLDSFDTVLNLLTSKEDIKALRAKAVDSILKMSAQLPPETGEAMRKLASSHSCFAKHRDFDLLKSAANSMFSFWSNSLGIKTDSQKSLLDPTPSTPSKKS
ncbi:pentapeptide repeat-containing protein [Legionella sp. 227]|uniref:pentapeptide repeat-containing protein n=1 Tax=Legionella sp. 227 TaxID=3367288 RepID=UPI00370DA6D3